MLRGTVAGLLTATAGCSGVLSGSEPEPLPTLTGVFITNRDPERKRVRIVIERGDTRVYRNTFDVEAYQPEGNVAGNAEVPPSEFDPQAARWHVTATLEGSSQTETFDLAQEVPDGEAYAVIVRVENDEIVFGQGTGFFTVTTTE